MAQSKDVRLVTESKLEVSQAAALAPIKNDVADLKVLGGINPGSVNDTTSANLIETNGTETRAALDASFVSRKQWRTVLDPEFNVTPAAAIRDVSITAGSSSITSPGGGFHPRMNGQYFWLAKGGDVLAKPVNKWEPEPHIGTFTYVSSTKGTLSSSATTTVSSGEIVIGPDATAGINAAIRTGQVLIPANTDLIVTSEIIVGSGQTLRGDSMQTSRIFSPIKNANVLVSAFTTWATVSNFSVYGNGYGKQPANQTPTHGSISSFIGVLAESGCGVTFAHTIRGTIDRIAAYHHGGDMVTPGRNGIAGIYVTMGCNQTQVTQSFAEYCRNGINEDGYFGIADLSRYAALDNTFDRNTANNCVFGIGIDSGSLSRGCNIDNHVSLYCVQNGIAVNASKYVTISNPRTEFCGLGNQNSGIQVYGTSSTVIAEHITISNPMSFGNGTYGIKISEWVRDFKIIGGIVARNQYSGLSIIQGCTDGKVIGLTSRSNAQIGPDQYDGIRVVSSSKIEFIGCHVVDDQATKTHRYGIYVEGSSDYISVDDATSISGFTAGPLRALGANSRMGSPGKAARMVLNAQGFRGEAFSRQTATGPLSMASGDQRASLVGLSAGDQVGSIYVHITTEGTGMTLARFGVWDSAGALVASTGDASASINGATGVRGAALTSQLTVPSDGAYYIGIITVGGTPPHILRGTSGITGYTGQPLGPNLPPSVGNTGKANIGAMTLTPSGNALWVAWA